MSNLTEIQKKMICTLPDCGGHDKYHLDGRVLKALVAKGYAARSHRDGLGQDCFDRYCRTREGRIALWGDDQLDAGTPLAEFSGDQ